MATISTYLKKKEEFEKSRQELEKLENDPSLKAEFAFMDAIKSFMKEHNADSHKMLQALASIDPSISAGAADGRSQRKLGIWRNPHTGEVVKTRGGNHKTLKAWREQYGKDTVAGWKDQ